MNNKACILVCRFLQQEVETALAAERLQDITVVTFPGDCDHPISDPEKEIIQIVPHHTNPVMALEGGCLMPHRKFLDKQGIHIHPHTVCFELLAGKEVLENALRENTHILTPGLLKHWREQAKKWAFEPEQAKRYFKESGSTLLLLDTGVDPKAEQRLQAFSEYSGRPAKTLFVGLSLLQAKIASFVRHQLLSVCQHHLRDRDRQLADAAMMVQMTGQLTGHWTEQSVIQGVLELFSMLYAPKEVVFVPLGSEEANPIYAYPYSIEGQQAKERCQKLMQITSSQPDGDGGFILIFQHRNKILAVLEVTDVAFPEHRDRYLNQAIQIGPVVGLALANARTLSAREQDMQKIATLNHNLTQRLAELRAVNEELEAFTYSVSHDLRDPLRAIDGFSAALLKDYAKEKEGKSRHYLKRVRAGAERMGQLIDDLLKLSRSTRGEMHRERCDISALAKRVVRALQDKDPERKDIKIEIENGLTAEADIRFIHVVLENLLGNAWKFTRLTQGATISVMKEKDEFVIADNGAGFNMAYAQRLFQPFQRLHDDREFEGSGIGLSTVKRIIQRHGGTIRADSAPDQGARFYFSLEAKGEAS
ncbi:ATP-binding protein [Magnetococcales bacterium HHB-1]